VLQIVLVAVRLWSLQTWTCLVCYKGHIFPVWDVRFAPHGYYFATAGHDKTARLWATDQHQPLRIFAGHFSDVDVRHFTLLLSGWDVCNICGLMSVMQKHQSIDRPLLPVVCLEFHFRYLVWGNCSLLHINKKRCWCVCQSFYHKIIPL
jgi:WD40 repeat protein